MKKQEPKKKPYEKPAIIHRQVMETVAGACQDAHGINGKADASCLVISS